MNVLRSVCGWYSLTMMLLHPASAQESKPAPTVSKETTHIVSPLRDDGRVDYIAAVNQQLRDGVTLENNSVVIFRRAVGRIGLSPTIIDEYFKLLGVDVPPADGAYLLDLDAFLDKQEASSSPLHGTDRSSRYERRRPIYEQNRAANSRPWTREEFPIIASWVDANEAPLKLVLEGSRRTKYFAPIVSKSGTLLTAEISDSQQARLMAELLRGRAMLYLGEDELELAWQDVMAIHRIARLVADGRGLLDSLVGIAIESFACGCDKQFAQHKELSEEFAARFLREFAGLELINGLPGRIDIEARYAYLDVIAEMAAKDEEYLTKFNFRFFFLGDKSFVESVRSSLLQRTFDVDKTLIVGNQWIDRYVEAAHQPTRKIRTTKFTRLAEESQIALDEAKKSFQTGKSVTPEESSQLTALAFLSSTYFLIPRTFDALDRCVMGTELSHCSFALAVWKATHGEYPSELALLSPDYLKTIPIDRFNEEPLIYRRTEVGYRLYSVGLNLTDDGGITLHDEFRVDGIETDDIAVRTPDEDERIRALIQARRSKQKSKGDGDRHEKQDTE